MTRTESKTSPSTRRSSERRSTSRRSETPSTSPERESTRRSARRSPRTAEQKVAALKAKLSRIGNNEFLHVDDSMKVGKVLKQSGMNKMLKQHPGLVYLLGARLVGQDGVVQKVAEQLGLSKGERIDASNVPEKRRSPKRRSPAKLLSMGEINALRDAVAQSRKVKRTPGRRSSAPRTRGERSDERRSEGRDERRSERRSEAKGSKRTSAPREKTSRTSAPRATRRSSSRKDEK
jgi:hypothetical protein